MRLRHPLTFRGSSGHSDHPNVALHFCMPSSIFLFSSVSEEKGGLVSEAYGEDDFSRLGGDEDGYEEEEDENSKQSVRKSQIQSCSRHHFVCQKSSNCTNSVPFHG